MFEQFGLVCLPMQAAAPVSKILVELATGVEPATCSLQVSCSAIEPLEHMVAIALVHQASIPLNRTGDRRQFLEG